MRFWTTGRRIIPALLLLCLLPQIITAQYVRRGKFSTEKQRRATYALDDWVSYTKTRRFTSATTGSNYLYISTRDGGILRYHLYDNYWDYPFTTSNGLPNNDVRQVIYDRTKGFLFAIFQNDIAVFDPAADEWIRKSERPTWFYELPDPEANNRSAEIPEPFFGREALFSLPTYFANGSYSITTDWLLVDEQFQEYDIKGYLIDRFKRIWFFVDGFGIGRGDTFSQRADFFEIGLPRIKPRAIAYQGDDIWIGGLGPENRHRERSGIGLWPYETIAWQYFQARRISHLASDNVRDIIADGDSVWFATDYGVALYDRPADTWKTFGVGQGLVNDDVRTLAIFGENLYAGTARGMVAIHRRRGAVERIKHSDFLNLEINRLAVSDNHLWAATFNGLFRLDAGSDKWAFVPGKSVVRDNDATAVTAFDQEIWIAGGGAVVKYDKNVERWEGFPQIGLEINGPFHDITADEFNVWVATNEGLLKYSKAHKFWKLFTTEDGLLNNRCFKLMLDGDYLWVVNDAGITQFFWNNPQRSDF